MANTGKELTQDKRVFRSWTHRGDTQKFASNTPKDSTHRDAGLPENFNHRYSLGSSFCSLPNVPCLLFIPIKGTQFSLFRAESLTMLIINSMSCCLYTSVVISAAYVCNKEHLNSPHPVYLPLFYSFQHPSECRCGADIPNLDLHWDGAQRPWKCRYWSSLVHAVSDHYKSPVHVYFML